MSVRNVIPRPGEGGGGGLLPDVIQVCAAPSGGDLKTCIHFAHFGLESGMVFEGTTGVYERIYRFNSK